MALSAIQKVMKDDERLLVYALHNLVQVFIGLSNPDGEMSASELLYQVRMYANHIHDIRDGTIQGTGVSMHHAKSIMIP